MALHESVLEEFGLAPRWVRRGMAAAQEAAHGPGAEQGANAPRPHGASDLTRLDARESSSIGLAPQTSPTPAMRAGEPSRRADGVAQAQTRIENDTPGRETQRSQPIAPRDDLQQAEPVERAEDSARFAGQSEKREPRPAPEATQQRAPLAAQSRDPATAEPRMQEPSSFDAPPADDFAWFDDLPLQPPGDASAPMHARRDTPEPPAIHTLDWDALSERVSTCERCRLCETRTRTVFGVGDRNADWMLIGEAPGENEDRVGEPFVGQAGKLLDNMLRSLTLARDTNVYIANVIKCRPPGNRNPEPDEVARCEPYLQRQVGLVKPKLIVALGRFAAQSLLKTDASISSLRGRVHEYEGVPVIVTYHPAYLLRSLPDKAKAWADLCLARDTWRAAGGAASNAANE
ncbi:uracil-DNA glycosylase family protein [Paraburkholderia kirstenboschensis]|uniref:Type-4 uracil-DNA glycosylase n=1 Tax=Paraburkholderia kirstenboschensis TaxID=1245436 RepID=A0ABZ0ER30_9BURK|nr:uracil-DNA glycosylase family protein [Paraburkholderia kirstenboschensis]WOD19638.1 uracil-DNA glycosylase family protein [Paraburkholderia kirstenboschensis]